VSDTRPTVPAARQAQPAPATKQPPPATKQPAAATKQQPPGDDSMRTVVLALAVNVAVAVIKAVAGVLTASAGLLAEAAHSVGDCTTEVFLMTALRRAGRPADRRHPFGYGKERYFWSLLAALTILVLGAGFSLYQGLDTILNGEADAATPVVGYVVIGLSAVVEAASWLQARGRLTRESRRFRMSWRQYVREPDDPTVKSVIFEDTAALLGLGLAAAGLLLRQLTGSALWDGIAALAIGALLVAVAVELARTNGRLLIGKQANPRLVADIRTVLEEQPQVLAVVDVLTMMIGTGRVLLCARLDYVDELSATDAEQTAVRLHELLRERFSEIDEVFLEPVPRADRALRSRADARQRLP
jgi:cation diffusion facilitator family transporter